MNESCIYCEKHDIHGRKFDNQFYCNKHYRQLLKHGKIERTIYDKNEIISYSDYAEIIIYNKKCQEIARALIDLEDIKRVKQYKWWLNSKGYIYTGGSTKERIALHRFIMNVSQEYEVDHIFQNPLDNRKKHLRVCTHQQNMCNQKMNTRNTSGYKGVTWDKERNKWVAQIHVERKHIYLGRYEDIYDAIKARKNAEEKYFREFSPLNNQINGG